MAWLPKKVDPVSARARDLNAEIAALEKQITQLSSQTITTSPQPRLRSTTWPHASARQRPATPEPVFEDVNQDRLKARTETITPAEQFNDLGVRKYDLPGLITRVKNQFSGPTASNPRLVNYLAAGGVQGLRPMRYEKRVARNRLLLLIAGLLLLLLIILSVFIKNH